MSPPGAKRGPATGPRSDQFASSAPNTNTVPGPSRAVDGSGVVLLAVELEELLAERCVA